jgi:hypothetical protein
VNRCPETSRVKPGITHLWFGLIGVGMDHLANRDNQLGITSETVVKIDDLKKQLRGSVLLQGSEEYEASRRIWNAMIDRRPHAIVCCSGPADVQTAVRFAAQEEICRREEM